MWSSSPWNRSFTDPPPRCVRTCPQPAGGGSGQICAVDKPLYPVKLDVFRVGYLRESAARAQLQTTTLSRIDRQHDGPMLPAALTAKLALALMVALHYWYTTWMWASGPGP